MSTAEPTPESIPCPDCGSGTIPRHDCCDQCSLSWEDVVAAAEFLDGLHT